MDQGDHMYTNRDTGTWLKLCADLEHEAAPPFPAPPLPQHIVEEFQLALQELGTGPLEPEASTDEDDDVGEDDKREYDYERPTFINPQTGALEVA